MQTAIDQFRANISRVRALGGLYQALTRLTTPAVDSTDLLRAQLTMTVSALDHYIHETTRVGMIEVFNGSRTATPAFTKFQVTMDSVINHAMSTSTSVWFDNEIREKHSYLSFQHPDRIADAIRLFSSVQLWPEVSAKLEMEVNDAKNKLRLIVERRNKIVHEADSNPSYPGTRWPISENDVNNTIDFIESLCEAIHKVI